MSSHKDSLNILEEVLTSRKRSKDKINKALVVIDGILSNCCEYEEDYVACMFYITSEYQQNKTPISKSLNRILKFRVPSSYNIEAEIDNLETLITNQCRKIEIAEGAIVCKKCKSRRTNTTTVNTRSGDEGSTKFVRCYDCGYNFRIG